MRFKKGSKVEVMNKKEVPISWRSAEIISGNGHTYCLRYDYHPVMIDGSMTERVSRKFVRPCPPPPQGVETWKVGDTVEVFEHVSWKIATILKVMQGDYYMVRLLGSSKESNVHKLNMREQCLWLDDKWILMGKKSGACGVNRVNKLSSSNFYQKTSFQAAKFNARTHSEAESKCLDIDKGTVLQESHKFSRSVKRLPPDSSSVIESLTGKAQKIRAVEKDGRKQKVAPPSLVEKVTDSVYSDAESFCGSKADEESCSLSLLLAEEVATSIHNLELHAYHCTLEALHASGPLSWDQQTLLTDLRIMLHISNDEHLMELRAKFAGMLPLLPKD